jgi:hypothetical protein
MNAYVINYSRTENIPVYIDVFSNLYNSQSSGTGNLTWSMVGGRNDFVINPSTALISLTPNTFFTDDVTVTARNAHGHDESITLKMNIAETPVINSPGTLYVIGSNVQQFSFDFDSIIPASRTGPLTWEVTQLEGLSINETTGEMVYNFPNIPTTQKLYVGGTYLM